MNKIIDLTLGIYLLNYDLKRCCYRVKWFTYHLSRCKKISDKIKLTLIITGDIFLCAVIISNIKELTTDIINSLCKPITRKPQLLLNARN